ncbi:MAG: NADH-quinone oxidoreductase subunit L [Acidiferrobacter sp.]
MNHWIWLIPALPLMGALANALGGGWLSPRWVGRIAAALPLAAAGVVLAVWLRHGQDPHLQERLWTWLAVGRFHAGITLQIDPVTLIMISIATGIGFLIHLFSQQFMAGDYGERRYYFYLNLFIGGMLVLTMADNLLLLYLGWETVGLCSYALISHWYRILPNARAGRKAFVVTRIGDTALALAIFVLFATYHTVRYGALFARISQHPDVTSLSLAGALLLIAAIAKSAQWPLHVWLPDSMAGPSTVSALIHAATMVTAGVYLGIRFYPLFAASPDLLWLIAWIGAVTAFYAASCALAQTDIKRVLAYSTISQLGYMFLAVGIGAPALALFHLLVQACFKSLLFMGAGVVIAVYHDDHDIRHMGGLKGQQPFLRWVFLAGIMALAAVPVVSASFYSKDAIIAATYIVPGGRFLWALALLGAVLTAAYAFRLYCLVFEGPVRPGEPYRMGWGMKGPLALLAAASIGIGWLQFPAGWPGPKLWLPWLTPELGATRLPTGSMNIALQGIGVLATLIGIGIGYQAARRERRGQGFGRWAFLVRGWFIDDLYQRTVVPTFLALAQVLDTLEERGFRRALLGGLRNGLGLTNAALEIGENGVISRYASGMVLGLLLLIVLTWGWL